MFLHIFRQTLFLSQMVRSIWKQKCLMPDSDLLSMPVFLYHELVVLPRLRRLKDCSANPCGTGTVPGTGIFAQFGSELDADTKEKLAQGERIKEMLKQPQYQPMPVEYQVMIIYAVTKKYVIDVAVDRILDFQKGLFELIDTKYPQIPETIRTTKVLDEETEKL